MTAKREESEKHLDKSLTETKLDTSVGPMTLQDALVDADKFVSGMIETKTYCQFVEYGPFTLRTLLKNFDGAEALKLEPYVHLGKSGTLVQTENEELFVRFCDRFASTGGDKTS